MSKIRHSKRLQAHTVEFDRFREDDPHRNIQWLTDSIDRTLSRDRMEQARKLLRKSFTSGAIDADSTPGQATSKGKGTGKDKGTGKGKGKGKGMAKVKVSTQGSSPIPASPMNPVAGATEEYATPTREMESATMKNCPHAHLSQ